MRVTSKDDLVQSLERFFKESRITKGDISVIRISEGLSIIERARNEEKMKKEFGYYENSLRTVLNNDTSLKDSVLARLMAIILELPDAKVSNLLILKDLMRLEDKEKSFKSTKATPDGTTSTVYSKMVSDLWSFKISRGMWSSEGFELGYSIVDSFLA